MTVLVVVVASKARMTVVTAVMVVVVVATATIHNEMANKQVVWRIEKSAVPAYNSRVRSTLSFLNKAKGGLVPR